MEMGPLMTILYQTKTHGLHTFSVLQMVSTV